MQKYRLLNTDGWVLLASETICRLQVTSGWHPGVLRVFIGTTVPDDTSPYFEVAQGDYFPKTTAAGKLYAYAPHSTDENPCNITLSEDTGTGGAGGSSSSSEISVIDPIFRIETASGTLATKPNSVTFYAKTAGTSFPSNGNGRIEQGQSITFTAALNNRLADIPYTIDPLGELTIIETVDPVPDAGAIIQTPTFTVVAADGTIATGASSITFYARIGGTTFPAIGNGRIEQGQSLTFTASVINTLGPIDYVLDPGGELTIIEVRS